MIDDKSDEMLSRYLDGDLKPEESREFEHRMEQEAGLREALEKARELRRGLRRLALAEQPPERLDQNLRLLRRAGRPLRQRWAGVAFVAAAAVIVIGSIVVLETGRTGWRSWLERPDDDRRPVFALSNPPARDSNAPLGAIESLMAESYPDPDLREPEPLEIVGPLDRSPEEGTGLVVLIGDLVLPLPENAAYKGMVVRLEVSQGRVVSCRAPDQSEHEGETGDLCRLLESMGDIGVGDGSFEATVKGWDG
ncbi:MAG: hypothetical protein K8R59_15415 [Thermoanaerobaculales bacterium]|nr:hypothetical protein [Thermoanaerobaculales bacterium]